MMDEISSVDEDTIAPRVGGLNYQYILNEHTKPVTGLVCACYNSVHFLISVSWDMSICIWEINKSEKHLVWKIEDAHRDYITDVDYSETMQMFATCSVDPKIHLWNMETRKVFDRPSFLQN
jgi:WD40 repeat protein